MLRALDSEAFEAVLSRWIAARLPAGTERIVSRDGKTLRGSRDGAVPGPHLVAAAAPQVQAVLAQMRVDTKTNEAKAALRLLGIRPRAGRPLFPPDGQPPPPPADRVACVMDQ